MKKNLLIAGVLFFGLWTIVGRAMIIMHWPLARLIHYSGLSGAALIMLLLIIEIRKKQD